jgi:hypothetical protein
MFYGQTNVPMEFSLTAAQVYRDIFNDVELDVLFTASDGEQWCVPAFWAGDNVFRVRFAAPKRGRLIFLAGSEGFTEPQQPVRLSGGSHC